MVTGVCAGRFAGCHRLLLLLLLPARAAILKRRLRRMTLTLQR
jgi:hypothetical protein